MSDKMFERIGSLQEELNKEVQRMNELEKKELELEYERLTGMECDDAAMLQTNEQFAKTIQQACENLLKRKGKQQVIEIYA
jgi:hypothetical protein